jgi:meso-butanediol dehydrogenase / (S,S)-butanediol dehydrogenase / diacetyl reductase
MRLAGKVAVVTGGAQGIGRGIVLCLAREGADVAVADLQAEKAARVADEAKVLGRRALGLRLECTQEAEFPALYERVRAELGVIDILVNNAGVSSRSGNPFTNNVEADWDLVWGANVKSIFFACKAITPHFIQRQAGKIINIASIAGPLATQTMPPYSVSKMGAITLTKIVAKDLAPHGINVNAICPGVVYTAFWEKAGAALAQTVPEYAGLTAREVFERRAIAKVPLGREQTPEDIGWAAVFLASDEARNITGQALPVDGGFLM